jgi:hypothetical protein
MLLQAESYAQNSQYGKFCALLSKAAPDSATILNPDDPSPSLASLNVRTANRLWLEMTEDRVGSVFDSGAFEVLVYPDPPPVLASQTVILRDDGKQTTGQILGNLAAAQARSLRVLWDGLTLEPPAPKLTPGAPPAPPVKPLPLSPLLGSFVLGDGGLSVTFPTLKNSGVKGDHSKVSIELNGVRIFSGNTVFVSSTQGPSSGAVGTFSVATDEIAQTSPSVGVARIVLNYSDDFKTFLAGVSDPTDITNYPLLTVSGQAAVVDTPASPAPAPLVADKKVLNAYRIKLTTSGMFDVPLSGLVSDQKITFSVAGPDHWDPCPSVVKNTAAFQGHP